MPAETTAEVARSVGMTAHADADVAGALARIAAEAPEARVLICGSLYLAGRILRENG